MNAPTSIRKLKDAVNRFRYRGFDALTTGPRDLAESETLSDQFLYRGDIAANRFVAENTLALLAGAQLEVTHRLLFFDPDGRPLGEQSLRSSRFFASIPIDPLGAETATFVHATVYGGPEVSLPPLAEGPSPARGNLQRLHRGYSLYQRTPQSVFAAVHGNFGGIVTDAARFPRRHRLLARRRGHFLYTAQHRFRPHERVTLFLMNPCPTAERVELFETLPGASEDQRPAGVLSLPSLGVRRCRLEGLNGYLTVRSRLPSCRPLIFVEDPGNPHHFDVFHT